MIMIKKIIIYTIIYIITIILNLCLISCSFMNTREENIHSTINVLPKYKKSQNESNHIQHKLSTNVGQYTNTNSSQKKSTKGSINQIITETRGAGGTVTSIKVDKSNIVIPPYYIDPPQNDNQDIQSDSTITPATWKISW